MRNGIRGIVVDDTRMTSTMKISEETKRALLKIGAEHTAKDGQVRSLEDIVKLLIQEHGKKPR